jgi:hypothetical protein
MPVWGWFFSAAIVVLVVLAVIITRAAVNRRRTRRLKERFGPEYERTVGEVGEQRSAEKELVARERKRNKLDIVALSPEARERYAATWRTVQTAFVDEPATAVGEADRLVTEVMRERGYPIDDFEQRAADVSVDHPQVVENYRSGHSIYRSQEAGDLGTEDQREAFVHYRALFEELLEPDKGLDTDKGKDKPEEARA